MEKDGKKRLSSKTQQIVNLPMNENSGFRFIVDESERWGRHAYFRFWDGKREFVTSTKFIDLESLGALIHQLNIDFMERMETFKKDSGF